MDDISETATDLSKNSKNLATTRELSLGGLAYMPARTHLLPLFSLDKDFSEIRVQITEG